MMTFHRCSNVFPKNEEIVTKWGDSWVVFSGEFINWYKENKNNVSDWNLFLKQPFGLSASSKNDTITLYWADPKLCIDPHIIQTLSPMR